MARETSPDDNCYLILDSGEQISGEIPMAKKLAEDDKSLTLEGESAAIVAKWVDFAEGNLHNTAPVDDAAFNKALSLLNGHLRLRTVFVGYTRTLADLAIWGSLKTNPKWDAVDKTTVPFLTRWYTFCEESNSFRTVAALSRSKIPPAKAAGGKKEEKKPKEPKQKQAAPSKESTPSSSSTTTTPSTTASSPSSTSPSTPAASAAAPARAIPAADPTKRLTMRNPCNNALIKDSPYLPSVTAHFDIELPNAELGKVVTRFPPEASGYLHIGHIKAAMLNEYYALNYQGKLLLRFDDTNPAKEKGEFENAIIHDLETVGIVPYRVSYTSDYFDLIFHCGTRMLELGKAYIDDLPVEVMRDNRMKGIESPMRSNTIQQNLDLWEEMKKSTPTGKKCVMRAKIDMQSVNTAMRDPVLFRSIDLPHARTGDRYKVYPCYDFACPIVDSIEGVTVSMRTIEYRDRNEQFHWIEQALGLRQVPIYDFARLNFKFVEMSKRKLQWFVDEKIAEGWFDPRFPTVQGMMRRGLTIPALRAFILEQGPSRNITYQEWDKIWAKNKAVISPIAPRYTAIETRYPVRVTLTDGPASPYQQIVPRNRKEPDCGDKLVEFSSELLIEQCDAELLKVGSEVTLMGWGNIIMDKIESDQNTLIPSTAAHSKGKKPAAAAQPQAAAAAASSSSSPAMYPAITHVTAHLHLEGDFKKTELKLTWLSCANALPASPDQPFKLPTCTLVAFDYLLTKPKIEENEDFRDFVNRNSKYTVEVYCEPAATVGVHGDIIQFERKGFFFLDKPFRPITSTHPASHGVFHFIPEGRQTLMRIAGVVPESVQDRAQA